MEPKTAKVKVKKGGFTGHEVIEYRRQYQSMLATGARTALFKRQIASRHGCNEKAVWRMLNNETYKWVNAQ